MSSNIPKMKCLIVDDEPLARFHLKELAERIDFLSVEGTCATALEADAKVKENEIDLLFLDINLPYLRIAAIRTFFQDSQIIPDQYYPYRYDFRRPFVYQQNRTSYFPYPERRAAEPGGV
jgi:CheY-like chemotaxis protein